MQNRQTLFLVLFVVLLAVIAWLIYDRQRSPLEKAADSVGDAVERVSDSVRDATR